MRKAFGMAIVPDTTMIMPRWTVPSFRRTPGRYPLGTEAVALGQMATELASGLPVLSRHPRYWSLYMYIIKRFWDSKRSPQNNAALGRFLKSREIVFALAALRCTRHGDVPLTGVVGRNSLTPWLTGGREDALPLDLPYLEQHLGGYGQIYRGALIDLGLILPDTDNPRARLDAPFGDLGAAVAERFAAAIAGTEYARKYAERDEGTIPLQVIDELSEASCFCRLVDHTSERDLLTDVLLGRVQAPHPAHRQRAATVRMILHLARETEGMGLDEARYRHLLYFGTDGGQPWPRLAAVEEIRRRWWLIQAREFVVGGLNGLFTDFVRWGVANGGLIRSIGIDAYAARVDGLTMPSLGELPAGMAGEVAYDDVVAALDAAAVRDGWPPAPGMLAPLSETALADAAGAGLAPAAPIYAALTLLLACRRIALGRAQEPLPAAEEGMVRDGGVERLSTQELIDAVERPLGGGHTFAAVIVDLVRRMVVRQHLRVARGKLPEETFRFHEVGGGLRFVEQGDAGLRPISIRFDAIDAALHGLGLLAGPLWQPDHAPTARGQEILDG